MPERTETVMNVSPVVTIPYLLMCFRGQILLIQDNLVQLLGEK